MSTIDLAEIKGAARNIVLEASDVTTMTPRIVREELEKQFSLRKGTLEAAEYKKAVKQSIQKALADRMQENARGSSSEPSSEEEEDEGEESPKRKRKSSAGAKTSRSKPTKKFKSASVVASSDIERDEPLHPVPQTSKLLPTSFKASVKPKPARNEPVLKGDSSPSPSLTVTKDDSSSDVEPTREANSTVKMKAALTSDDENLAEVVKDPPKKRKKSESTKKASAKPVAKRTKKPEDKDEATIKRLKSYVTACGVRKQWGKLFEGVDRPSAQINIIKKVLKELGMDGRPSMEQAKRIREQRELAADLEAVQSYEKSALVRGSRRAAPKAAEETKEDSESEVEKPAKRTTARQSIMAFLGSDSDSD